MADNRNDGDDSQYARTKTDQRRIVGGNARSDKEHSQKYRGDKHFAEARDRARRRKRAGGAREIQRCSLGRFAALGAELGIGGDRG